MLICWYVDMLICWYVDILIRWYVDMYEQSMRKEESMTQYSWLNRCRFGFPPSTRPWRKGAFKSGPFLKVGRFNLFTTTHFCSSKTSFYRATVSQNDCCSSSFPIPKLSHLPKLLLLPNKKKNWDVLKHAFEEQISDIAPCQDRG